MGYLVMKFLSDFIVCVLFLGLIIFLIFTTLPGGKVDDASIAFTLFYTLLFAAPIAIVFSIIRAVVRFSRD